MLDCLALEEVLRYFWELPLPLFDSDAKERKGKNTQFKVMVSVLKSYGTRAVKHLYNSFIPLL